MIGTLAVDRWAVTLGTASPSPLLAVSNVTAHPSTASVLHIIRCVKRTVKIPQICTTDVHTSVLTIKYTCSQKNPVLFY